MRLIDADALKEKIDSMWNGRPLSLLGARILAMIDNTPSIDIVPCRECKYARNIEGEWICEHLSGMVGLNVLVKADDFCSYGSRSEKPNNSERSSDA